MPRGYGRRFDRTVAEATTRNDQGWGVINAVYENGVFRPEGAVDLAEGTAVMVFPQLPAPVHDLPADFLSREPTEEEAAAWEAIFTTSYDSGHTDTAERHNEHQP